MFSYRGIYDAYLGLRPASEFRLVATTERHSEFCLRLSELIGVEIDPEVRERPAGEFRYVPTDEDASALRDLSAAEIEWFEEFSMSALSR